jgi:tetratricopeptide (TPR) repeat protein
VAVELHLRRAGRKQASASDFNTYALILLTCEPEDLRKPKTALHFAQEAVEETGEKNYRMLQTLALAYQMTGEADKAVETQRIAIALLPPDPTPSRTVLETQLGEYLVELGNFGEAEPLLINVYEQMEQREYVKQDDMKETLERLGKLYESWHLAEPGKGYDAKATEWLAKVPKEELKEEK